MYPLYKRRRTEGRKIILEEESGDEEDEIENVVGSTSMGRQKQKDASKEQRREDDEEDEGIYETDDNEDGQEVTEDGNNKKGKSNVKRVKNSGKKVKSKAKRRIDDYFEITKEGGSRCGKGDCYLIKSLDWYKNKKTVANAKYDMILDVIKMCRGRLLDLLDECCLKNVLKMSVRKFPTKLIQHLLSRPVKNEKPDELSFKIGDEIHTFTLMDFCLITGLNCNPVKNVDRDLLPESELLETIFADSTKLDWNELDRGFRGMNFCDEELALKMVKLYVLESLVIPKQIGTTISNLHFRMVENDEVFDGYSWGRLSYNLTIVSIKKILDNPEGGFKRLTGFPQALVIWACEILLALSLNAIYAKRIGDGYPRMLNWDYHKQGTWQSYEKDVFNDALTVKGMKPTDEELDTEYMKIFKREYKKKQRMENENGEKSFNCNGWFNEDDNEGRNQMAEDIKLILHQNYTMRQTLVKLEKKVDELHELVKQGKEPETRDYDGHRYEGFGYGDNDNNAEHMFTEEVNEDVLRNVNLDNIDEEIRNVHDNADDQEIRKEDETEISPVKISSDIMEWLKNKEQSIIIYRGEEHLDAAHGGSGLKPTVNEVATLETAGRKEVAQKDLKADNKGKGKKADNVDGLKKGRKRNEKKNMKAATNVSTRPKRTSKDGKYTTEPYTEKFGSNEKDMKGPSFHVLTPPTQEE